MLFLADTSTPEAAQQAVSGAHEGLPLAAVPLFKWGFFEVTNSALVSYVVAAFLIIIAQAAFHRPKLSPGPLQNFVEWVVESLQGMLQSILGTALSRKTSWLFCSLFIFILTANWFGLFPGVGTIGWGYRADDGQFEVVRPLIRGANADVNMTLALSLISFGYWIVWALQANGIWGTLVHIFGPKGGIKGFWGFVMGLLFIAIGSIELLSILVRPLSLTFRLYGNIFGGENMIDKMMSIVPQLSWLIPLPVYFFELLVGFVQALVFFLLTAVFTLMICQHDEPASGRPKSH